MTKFGHYVRQAAASLVLIGAVLGSYAARADQILSDSHMLAGTSVISDVGYTFTLSGPGTLSVNLKDLSWPTSSLTDLSFSAFSVGGSSMSLIGQFDGAGMANYDIGSGGTIYAYVTGEASNPASGPAFGAGLYTLDISFAPSAVPLPASLGLLLAALLGFAVLQRRTFKRALLPGAHPLSV
jgi:hypothetical protein